MRAVSPRGTFREASAVAGRGSCISGTGAALPWVHCISAPVAVVAGSGVESGVSSGCVVIVRAPVVGSTGPLSNRAVPSGLVPVVPSCSERIAVALPVRTTQHTSRDPQVLGGTDVRLHDLQRAWGRCLSPLEVSLAACVRQSRFRRDVLPTPLFHRPASPVRTAAVRRCFFEGGCTSGRLAQLCSRRALRSRLTPSPPEASVLSGGPGAPAG